MLEAVKVSVPIIPSHPIPLVQSIPLTCKKFRRHLIEYTIRLEELTSPET